MFGYACGAYIGPKIDTIAPVAVNDGTAISVDANDGGDDVDGDGGVLSYTCTYDTTVDGAVSSGSSCAGIAGDVAAAVMPCN